MKRHSLPRCLLFDQSASERASLRQKIELSQLATVAGEASTLVDARHLIATEPHDLVLTDTRLGSGDAMQLAAELRPGVRIAFVSERSSDAVRAFECDALDFLPKPVSPQRLAITFSRLSLSPGRGSLRVREVRASHPDAGRVALGQKLCIRSGTKARIISPDQIVSIAAQDNYSEISLLAGDRVFVRQTMRTWEAILPPRYFFRIHRARIVNLLHISTWWREARKRVLLGLHGQNTREVVSRQRWLSLAAKLALE